MDTLISTENLNSDSIKLIIQILSFVLGGGIIFTIGKQFKKPKIRLISEIEKDLNEYLFAVKFKLKNIGSKYINLENTFIKIHDAIPPHYNDIIDSLISYKWLLRKKRKLKFYKIRIRVPVRGQNNMGEYSLYPDIGKNIEKNILVSGLTTDTKGNYELSLQIICSQKLLGFIPIKSKWFYFDYQGEVPPAILVVGKNNLLTKKIALQLNEYIYSSSSKITGYFSIRQKSLNIENRDDAIHFGKSQKADFVIWIKTKEQLKINSDKIEVVLFGEQLTNDIILQYKSINLFSNKPFYLDKFNIKHKEYILPEKIYNDLKVFLHDIILYLSLKHNKPSSSIENFDKIIELLSLPWIMINKAYYASKIGRHSIAIKTLDNAIKYVDELILKPELIPDDWIGASPSKLMEIKLTIENNLGTEFYICSNYKNAFYWFCRSMAKNIWFQPYDTLSFLWEKYTGISPRIDNTETVFIVNEYLKGTEVSDIKDWFITKRKKENMVTSLHEPVNIFDESNNVILNSPDKKMNSDEYLNMMNYYTEKLKKEIDFKKDDQEQ